MCNVKSPVFRFIRDQSILSKINQVVKLWDLKCAYRSTIRLQLDKQNIDERSQRNVVVRRITNEYILQCIAQVKLCFTCKELDILHKRGTHLPSYREEPVVYLTRPIQLADVPFVFVPCSRTYNLQYVFIYSIVLSRMVHLRTLKVCQLCPMYSTHKPFYVQNHAELLYE